MTRPGGAVRRADTRVVVVGAGPVGLMLAVELRRAHVPVIIVERLASPMTESRASQLNTRTAEILHERGLDSLLGPAARELTAHFGGLAVELSGLDSEYAGNWKVPQYQTEHALGRSAQRLGATLLRQHELRAVRAFEDHARCDVDGPAGKRLIRARYVVGCDGAASTVRQSCGFTASRTSATKELLRADVTGIEIPDRRFERLANGFAVAATRDSVTRVMVHESGRGAVARKTPPEFAEVARAWQRVTGDDISGGRAIWVDSFDNGRGQVTCYRRGRVFLAGDAAHWHMPIGGQALNVGLQDAVNLGWKLAGSAHGWAPPGLLDTYHSERHPVAAAVLRSVAAQELLLLGGGEIEPLRAMLSEVLGLDRARDHVALAAAGLDIRYALGDHPLIGRRLPNVELKNECGSVTTAELLADAKGLILKIANADQTGADSGAGSVLLASGCRLRTMRAVPARSDVFGDATIILVRPDGYISWAGHDEAGLNEALMRWFGAPLPGVGPADHRR